MAPDEVGEHAAAGADDSWRRLPAVQRLIRSQTILNVALNAVLPTFLLWIVGVPAPARVLGIGGLLQGLIVGVVVGTILTFVSTTRAARRRLEAGTVPPLVRARLHSVVRLIPAGDPAALIVILVMALVFVIPAGVVVAIAAHRLPMSMSEYAVANAAVGTAVGLWVAPRVVLHALSAPMRRSRIRPGARHH